MSLPPRPRLSFLALPPPGSRRLPWTVRLPAAGVGLTQVVKQRQGRRLVRLEVRAVIGAQAALPYLFHLNTEDFRFAPPFPISEAIGLGALESTGVTRLH